MTTTKFPKSATATNSLNATANTPTKTTIASNLATGTSITAHTSNIATGTSVEGVPLASSTHLARRNWNESTSSRTIHSPPTNTTKTVPMIYALTIPGPTTGSGNSIPALAYILVKA